MLVLIGVCLSSFLRRLFRPELIDTTEGVVGRVRSVRSITIIHSSFLRHTYEIVFQIFVGLVRLR